MIKRYAEIVLASIIGLLLAWCITYLLALAGEPQSLWLMRDVFGLIE